MTKPQTPVISIQTNGKILTGWTSVKLVRSIEQMPSTFEVQCTEIGMNGNAGIVTSGDTCVLMADGDVLCTGYIGPYLNSIEANNHTVGFRGTSKCIDLVTCQAVLHPSYLKPDATILGNGQFTGTMNQTAKLLSAPYGISVDAEEKIDFPFQNYQTFQNINVGETPYEIIERLSRIAKVLVYDDVNGNLVLDDIGTQSMSSGFTQGQAPLKSANVTFDQTERYSDFYTTFYAWNSEAAIPENTNKAGYAQDPAVKRFKCKMEVSEQNLPNIDLGQARADWEVKRRIGRSQAVTVVVNTWRDSSGTLWDVNKLAAVNIPSLHIINQNWIISQIVFELSVQTGTIATITLMPPDAFAIEPEVLIPDPLYAAPTSVTTTPAPDEIAVTAQKRNSLLPGPRA